MNIESAVILGVVQGITEFVPISSSGHLILSREILGIASVNGLAFDAVLQLATSLAIFVYFRRDLTNAALYLLGKRDGKESESLATSETLLKALIVGTIPAVVLGLLLETYMETLFRTPVFVAGTLIAGAILMFGGEYFGRRNARLTTKNGWWIGFFQALALFPGMSRSGSTLAGGLFFGLTREDATRFSFMLGFPILLGSGGKKLLDLFASGGIIDFGTSLFVGSVVAFCVGLAAMHYLIQYLREHTLYVFVGYRILLAVTAIMLFI